MTIPKDLTLKFSIIFSSIILDQLSKIYVRANHLDLMPSSFLGGFFKFQYAENTGAFLSLGATMSADARFWIFNILTSAVLSYFAFILFTSKKINLLNKVVMSLIVGGGIGNLIDRFFRGSVTDFMIVDINFARTGIFNIADMAITLAAGLLIYEMILEMKNKKIHKKDS